MSNEGGDPYEERLLAVFKSCDKDNSGKLDRQGLKLLCEELQLEDLGTKLIQCFTTEFVTFAEFREALIALLDKIEGDGVQDQTDSEASAREISPKFVVGKKKYGRRTRPKSTDVLLLENEEDSDSDITDATPESDKRTSTTSKAAFTKKRKTSFKLCASEENSKTEANHGVDIDLPSTSAVDADSSRVIYCLWSALQVLDVGQNGWVNKDELIAVCRSVGMASNAEEVVEEAFSILEQDSNNCVEFEKFLRLRSDGEDESPSEVGEVRESDSGVNLIYSNTTGYLDDTSLPGLMPDGMLSAEMVLAAWEAAGVRNGQILLQDLGYEAPEIQLSELIQSLDNELQESSVIESAEVHQTLLLAQNMLYKIDAQCSRCLLGQVLGENSKLRIDIGDANERAALLAQEVDDRHSRLESENRQNIKSLELRYSESIREVTQVLTAERDGYMQQNQTLERRILDLEAAEVQTRTEMEQLKKEAATLDTENQSLLEKLVKTEARLQKEREAVDNLLRGQSDFEVADVEEQVNMLFSQLEDMQKQNTILRDRNDELSEKVENLSARLEKLSMKKPGHKFTLASEDKRLIDHESSNKSDTSEELVVLGGATKRRGDPPDSLSGLEDSSEEESPRLEKVRRCCSTPDAVPLSDVVPLDSTNDEEIPLVKVEVGTSQFHEMCHTLDMTDEEISLVEADNDNELFEELTQKLSVDSKDQQLDNLNVTTEVTKNFNTDDESNIKEQLQQHCHDLKTQLDQMKVEIVKIMSERNITCNENCILKADINDLKDRLVKSLATQEAKVVVPDTGIKEDEQVATQEAKVVVPDTGIKEDEQVAETFLEIDGNESAALVQLKRKFLEKMQVMKARYEKEQNELEVKCADLVNSLNLLRDEYEKCEDYWSAKLDEERILFDREQAVLDTKYKSIVKQMEDYGLSEKEEEYDDGLASITEYAELESQIECVQAEKKMLEESMQLESNEKLALMEELKSTRALVIQYVSEDSRRTNSRIEQDDFTDQQLNTSDIGIQTEKAEECMHNDSPHEFDKDVIVEKKKKEKTSKPEKENYSPHVNVGQFLDITSRLKEQERRLEDSLHERQMEMLCLIESNWKLHRREVADLQALLETTQANLLRQTVLYVEQVDKIAKNDVLIKDLYVENAELTATVHRLEVRLRAISPAGSFSA